MVRFAQAPLISEAPGMELRLARTGTRFGAAYTCETQHGVAFAGLGEPPVYELLSAGFHVVERPQWQDSAQLLRAFADEAEEISATLHLSVGSPFQQACYRALPRIPRGETISYGDLAALAGRPGAHRAAGTAMANTPLPFFLPCHRVILSSGALGGYGDREDVKLALLLREGARVRPNA